MTAQLHTTYFAMRACSATFSRQLAAERMFCDANAGWVMAPMVEHLHDFIGKAVAGMSLL